MARFNNGWVKVYRSAWENDLGDNPLLFALWGTLLVMATWRESKILWKGHQRVLPPGSVVLGVKEIADKWGCSRSVVRKWLKYLHDTQRIVLESCAHGTLVTICNWSKYQATEEEACAESVHGVGAASSPRVHGEPLIEEVKKERKEEVSHAHACFSTWKDTLKHRGVERDLYAFEQVEIARKVQSLGAEVVDQALYGFRFEESFDGYDAKKNLKLARVFEKEQLDKWINLAASNRPVKREVVEWEFKC